MAYPVYDPIRYPDRYWDRDRDWNDEGARYDNRSWPTYDDNLQDANLENMRGVPRASDYWRQYNEYWRNRTRDAAFHNHGPENLIDSNLQQRVGARRNYGSRYDQYYQPGMPMRGYAYDYTVGRGFDNWRDTNLEDFGEPGNEANYFGEGFDYDWTGNDYNPQFHYVEFWNVPGPYSGIGPQGYRRSDERIREDVCERLTQNGQVDSSGIDVDVRNGEIFLSGQVDRRREKAIAEDIAYSVPGVEDVRNEIKIDVNDGARMRGVGEEDIAMFGRIKQGMNVIGRNGAFIGRVKVVRSNDFLVDRPMRRDIFVPFSAVRRTNGDVLLRFSENEIGEQDWPRPQLFGSDVHPRDWRRPK